MSSYRSKSTNPFEEDLDDIDDETFLQNSRRPPPTSQSSFDTQVLSFQERMKQIEESTISSTQQSLNILRDSEHIGIATAEELMRQREKLENTDKQLDDINNTLRFSQKHINGIKSVFSSLKNYMSGRNDKSPTTPTPASNPTQEPNTNISANLQSYDRYDEHPATRLRGNDYSAAVSGSRDFSARLDANLQEMCTNISRLKGLAGELGQEIDSQNDLIDNITCKADQADMTLGKQNKDIMKLLKK